MPDAVYDRVVVIVEEVLKRGKVDPSSDLIGLGVTSLMILQIIERVDQLCGVEVSVIDVLDADDVASLATLVDRSARLASRPSDRRMI